MGTLLKSNTWRVSTFNQLGDLKYSNEIHKMNSSILISLGSYIGWWVDLQSLDAYGGISCLFYLSNKTLSWRTRLVSHLRPFIGICQWRFNVKRFINIHFDLIITIHQSDETLLLFGPIMTEPKSHQCEAFDSCIQLKKIYRVIFHMHPANEWMRALDLMTLKFYFGDTAVMALRNQSTYNLFGTRGQR